MSTQMAKLPPCGRSVRAGSEIHLYFLNPDHVLVKRTADTEDEAQFKEWVELSC